MAKETVYNNTLVSGAADETLTYTRYVKDESSGKSTKELLDEKVNKTDQLGTTQIADKAVTTEKLENESVTTDKLDAASVTTDKVADANITTSKLADSSVETEKINNKAVTTDKLNDGAVDNTKLSPNAVTSDKIKNESIITEKLNDRAVTTEKIEEKAITNAKLGDQSVDGRVVREASLETKNFANESVTTEKVARKSITKDKLADNAVDSSQVVDGSIGNAKLSPDSVTTEKIKDGSVTNEKIADNTLGIGKFDPELRKTIQAATGLPDDLNKMIQDIDLSVKQLHEKDTDLQSQIDDKQQQITANDDDISLLQTRSTQMEEAIKGISASGGASQASAVTYENTESGLDSVTAQGAIDELANKNKSQDTEIAKKANSADVDSQIQTEQERVNAKLDKKFDKENIAQEFGDSEDKVVSQFAIPFREIESPEFIKAIVDAEDHFLFGIQLDGSIEWGKGIPAPIRQRIQEVLNYVGDEFASLSDKIESIKLELSGSLQTYQQTTDATLANLQETKVDKEEGKSLIENEVKECFRIIENEEFLKAIVDSDDKVLFGIYRATGEPYYPLNEMYHVIQNEEYFAAWVTTDNKVVLGIRRDGQIIGEIHAVNALKQVIYQLQSDLASLQEKVCTIDTNLKELLDVFSLQENSEYLAVEKDAEGKVLSATYNDGSHYFHNLKSETIDDKVDKEQGKSLIDSDVAGAHRAFEDPEERFNIELDSESRVLSYRDKNGIKNENVGFNTPNYYKNGKKCEWIEDSDVIPIVKKSDDIPLSILDGVSNHNTPNLIVPSDIQKTFNDGTHSFTPPNAGYEMSNRIECEAGDWFTRTGTATDMIVVTDSNDKNGQRLFNSDGTTLGSTFQIPEELTWVKYIRMAVDAAAAKAGEVVICRGKKAYSGELNGDFLTLDKLRVMKSNMPKDLRFLKTSNGDYYELYIDEKDFSVKARKIDTSVITDLPDDFPVFNAKGDFSKYFNYLVAMPISYMVEQNQNGVTAYQKMGANAYYYAEFRKERSLSGQVRYVAMHPYYSYKGVKGEIGLTIYDKKFNVVETNIKASNVMPDAHDFVYIDDNHVILVGYGEKKNITITQGSESLNILSQSIYISEIKKINGHWTELASFDTNDYPQLLTDGINNGCDFVRTHWNTVQLDYDGNLLINMRDMNCFWKIKRVVDSNGSITIGSKTKDYNEAIIGRVGGVYNSGYIDSKRVLEEGFQFTDIPSSLGGRSSDKPSLWNFYHEHDVTYWGKKMISGEEYPTYILFDNNMWTGETPTGNYYDVNPRNNYKNNPNGNNDHYFVASKSDKGAYDEKMVSRIVQLSIDWTNHLIKDYKVYEISKKYSYTRSSVQMFDEGVLLISWADQSFVGLYDFNDESTEINGKLLKNGKELFSAKIYTYRVHGYK